MGLRKCIDKTFEDNQEDAAERYLTPLEIATDMYLATRIGSTEARAAVRGALNIMRAKQQQPEQPRKADNASSITKKRREFENR